MQVSLVRLGLKKAFTINKYATTYILQKYGLSITCNMRANYDRCWWEANTFTFSVVWCLIWLSLTSHTHSHWHVLACINKCIWALVTADLEWITRAQYKRCLLSLIFFVTLRLDSKCHLNCPQYTRWISDGRSETITVVFNWMWDWKHVNEALKWIQSFEHSESHHKGCSHLLAIVQIQGIMF